MFLKRLKNKGTATLADKILEVKKHPVPGHIAIIMDGNGRWAKKRALPRVAGHHEGMKTVKKITRLASELGVEVLTVYAFSTENWKRPQTEVDFIMKLPEEFLGAFLPELIEQNVRVQMIGEPEALPAHTLKVVQKAMRDTEKNTGMILNFALNYGSRSEILVAMKHMMKDISAGVIGQEQIDEKLFSSYLMTDGLADPDLLIRTSGELRLSNFMLWQSAYTEFWFTDVYWPDFSESHLLQAVHDYQSRSRRYGGV
ncbi:isoprenyl transferase [Peribacillus sp. SCS-37]|uniref:isoprenyl transferase n=1 Tax=Paraperibacillus esterisolvens TaxID=3115296 RepID=UPI003906B9BA